MQLVYISPVPWASFAQRPHKFVEWFHETYGCEVLWVNPYPTRLPALIDLVRLVNKETGTSSGNPKWLTVVNPRSIPVEPLPYSFIINRLLWKNVIFSVKKFINSADCIIGIGKPSDLALQVLNTYPDVFSFYDAMDNFPAFCKGLSRFKMEKTEKKIVSDVKKIIVSSSNLAHHFSELHPDVSLALNACDISMFSDGSSSNQTNVKPVIGYVGMMKHWFDWSLVIAIAEAVPTACIRLIGPIHVPSIKPLPKNIELLPACDHMSAIKAMQDFSIGLIPFKKNELTDSVDPVKYYEYRALGLPVLSTRFGEMELRDCELGVFLMDADTDLNTLVKDALNCKKSDDIDRAFIAENSWSDRFDNIFDKCW